MLEMASLILLACFDALFFIFYVRRLLEYDRMGRVEVMVWICIATSNFMSHWYSQLHIWFSLVSLSIVLVYVWGISGKKLLRGILSALTVYTVLGVITMITVYLMDHLTIYEFLHPNWSVVPDRLVIFSISKILSMLVCGFILKFSRKSLMYSLSIKEWLIFLISTVMVLLVLLIMFYSIVEGEHRTASLYSLIGASLIWLLTTIYFILVQINQAAVERYKYQKMVYIYETEQKMLMEKELEYRNLRIIRHDLRHYFSTATSLLQEGKCQEAMDYMQLVTSTKIERLMDIVETGNDIIDASINSKLIQCKEQGIEVETSLSGRWEFENSVDIGIVLCNLIENACQAASRAENPFVSIHSRMVRNYLQIDIRNSVSKNRYSEAVDNMMKDEHGWGLQSTRQILNQYNALLSNGMEEGDFLTTVLIPELDG